MKRFIATVLVLCQLVAAPAWAAIGYVAGDVNWAGPVSFQTYGATNSSGQTGMAILSLDQASGARTVTSITDDASSVWVFGAAITNGNTRVELWHCLNVLGANLNLVANFSASTDSVGMTVQFFSGVAGIGTSNTASGTGTSPSVAITTQDANNFVLGGFAFRTSSPSFTWTAATGNLRNSYDASGSSAAAVAAVDNTSAGAGSVTTSATINSSIDWAAVALELRSTIGTPPASVVQAIVID